MSENQIPVAAMSIGALANVDPLLTDRYNYLPSVLDVLRDQLPDPDLKLFYQWLTPTEFHLFKKLPLELRVKIW